MDFDFLVSIIPTYLQAAILTLKLAFFGILFSIIVGLFCVYFQYRKILFLNYIVSCYIELSRNTPLLIQLFFLYYGLPKINVNIESMTCAIIGLTFLGGSYMAESFRLGFEAIKRSQIEAGMSLGLNDFQILLYVILPKAINTAIPSIAANVIFLLKETSVVGIIALADLVYVAKDIIGLYYKTDEALLLLVISYLILILPTSIIFTILEKRLSFARG